MKKQLITAVILAAMLVTACAAASEETGEAPAEAAQTVEESSQAEEEAEEEVKEEAEEETEKEAEEESEEEEETSEEKASPSDSPKAASPSVAEAGRHPFGRPGDPEPEDEKAGIRFEEDEAEEEDEEAEGPEEEGPEEEEPGEEEFKDGIRAYSGKPRPRAGKEESEEEKAEEEEPEEAEEAGEEPVDDEYYEEEEEFAPSDGLVFKSNRDGTATITGIGTCTDTTLVIPGKSPKGDVVTAIAEGAFDHAKGIDTVVFKDSSLEIGKEAFSNSSVENLLVYDSMLSISEDAFSYCEDLSYFYADGSTVIADPYAFDSAFDGADFVFADSVLLFDDESFVYSGVRTILAEECTIVIGEDAFDYCEDIEAMEMIDCLVDIGKYAFFCTGDQMEVLFEECDVMLDENAFAFSDIVNLEINGSTVEIGEDAFDYCEALENIIVRASVVTTDPYAFYGCGNQAKVVFENGEVTLGRDAFAFADIVSLKMIRCEADIGQEAFKSCTNLERVDICSGNIKIGRRAFYHCTGLKDVSLSDNTSSPHTISIGDDAFEFSGLEKVTLGKGSIEIGSGAFRYSEELRDVKIRGELASIGRNAFYRCHSDLTIHYDGEEYDSKTIQEAVIEEEKAGPKPNERTSRLAGEKEERQAEKEERQTDREKRQTEREEYEAGQKPGTQAEQKPGTQAEQKPGIQSEQRHGTQTENEERQMDPRIQAPRSAMTGPGSMR